MPSGSDPQATRITHKAALRLWPDYAALWFSPDGYICRGLADMRRVGLIASMGRSRGAAPVCVMTGMAVDGFRAARAEWVSCIERMEALPEAQRDAEWSDRLAVLKRMDEVAESIDERFRKIDEKTQDTSPRREYSIAMSAFDGIKALLKEDDASTSRFLPTGSIFPALRDKLKTIYDSRVEPNALKSSPHP